MDGVERIEVALRTLISNYMSEKYGAHWFLNSACFNSNRNYHKLVEMIEKSTGLNNPQKRNESCKHYYEIYTSPKLPPSWIVTETLSLGNWSWIFDKLTNDRDKKSIAREINLPFPLMKSWLISLTYLRNLCAHHQRIWNRKFTITPSTPKKKNLAELFKAKDKFWVQAVIINILLKEISRNPTWIMRISNLLESHPVIDLAELGFPPDWKKQIEDAPPHRKR